MSRADRTFPIAAFRSTEHASQSLPMAGDIADRTRKVDATLHCEGQQRTSCLRVGGCAGMEVPRRKNFSVLCQKGQTRSCRLSASAYVLTGRTSQISPKPMLNAHLRSEINPLERQIPR